jgi:8-amino-7-oxononanoate synthase
MQPPLIDRMERDLAERRAHGLFRSLPAAPDAPDRDGIDLSTNSYLSLHKIRAVHDEAVRLTGNDLSGNHASRLISDTSPLARLLEAEIADWKSTETALLFNSGYAANLGIIQALCSRDTEIFCDRLNHASIIDGIRLSGCRLQRYRHCDMSDLGSRLSASRACEKIIVTDTIFSMDGDKAPLQDICTLAQSHNALVMADEAHATGIFGPNGSGVVEESGCANAVAIRMGTLSKAIAGLGAFFAGSTLIRDYLINHSRSLIYSTGLPHPVLAWDLAAVKYVRANPGSGAELLRIAEKLRCGIRGLGFDTLHSCSQIIPCIVGDDTTAIALSGFLKSQGIFAAAIRPPTVPQGTSRVRFSAHHALSSHDIDAVLFALKEWKSRHD